MISLVRVNSLSFLYSKRHIIKPGFKAPRGKMIIGEYYVTESVYIRSYFKLGEDVELKASG